MRMVLELRDRREDTSGKISRQHAQLCFIKRNPDAHLERNRRENPLVVYFIDSGEFKPWQIAVFQQALERTAVAHTRDNPAPFHAIGPRWHHRRHWPIPPRVIYG